MAPVKEIDYAKAAMDIAKNIEKVTTDINGYASIENRKAMAQAYGIPPDSALFKTLVNNEVRTPETIKNVVLEYFKSNPEIQSSLRQNELLRQVNKSRMPSINLLSNAIKMATDALSVNNIKRDTNIQFIPKHILGNNANKESSNNFSSNTIMLKKHNNELEKGFWGRIGGALTGDNSDYITKETFKDNIDNYIKDAVPIGENKEPKYNTEEFRDALNKLQNKYGFNDKIKRDTWYQLHEGKKYKSTPLAQFMDSYYDNKINNEVTAYKIDGKSADLKLRFNSLLREPFNKEFKVYDSTNDEVDFGDSTVSSLINGSEILSSHYVPQDNELIISFTKKDKDGKTGQEYRMHVKPTPEEIKSFTGAKILSVDNKAAIPIKHNGKDYYYVIDGKDENYNPSFKVYTTTNNNINKVDPIIIDSNDKKYSNLFEEISKYNHEIWSNIFKN